MTPIEQAARALHKRARELGATFAQAEWEGPRSELLREAFTELAHAVLLAIREPSEGMIGACDAIGLEEVSDDPDRAKLFWHAMIDAALATKADVLRP